MEATLPEGSNSYPPLDSGQPQAYFYLDALSCVGAQRAPSNRSCWFRFSLTPGS